MNYLLLVLFACFVLIDFLPHKSNKVVQVNINDSPNATVILGNGEPEKHIEHSQPKNDINVTNVLTDVRFQILILILLFAFKRHRLSQATAADAKYGNDNITGPNELPAGGSRSEIPSPPMLPDECQGHPLSCDPKRK